MNPIWRRGTNTEDNIANVTRNEECVMNMYNPDV